MLKAFCRTFISSPVIANLLRVWLHSESDDFSLTR